MRLGGRGARRVLIGVIAIGFALRLSVWSRIFAGGNVYLDGPDGYYHLRRAAMTVAHWPLVPTVDPMINYPAGGVISWPPLFDGLLATLALPFRTDRALELIGAFLPPVLGALQLIVLFLLVHSLRGRRAALAAVVVAAILPSVVRYTLLGNLDHDPFFTLCLLLALLGVARENVALLAVGFAFGILGWTGAIVGIVIVTAVALAIRKTEAARALGIGASIAAVVVLPFVIGSPWRGASFEGLSWLHIGALAVAGLIGCWFGGLKRLAIANTAVAIALAPICVRPFLSGAAYAAGDAPILAMVAEAQPLLRLFGRFDLWPLLIRFGLLPVVFIAALVMWARTRETARDLAFVAPWVAITLTLAFLHSRFSFDAGVALAAFAGIAFERVKPSIVAFAMLPIIPAYLPLPSLEAFNFYLRPNVLREYGMERICTMLRDAPPGAVIAPWEFGHWIVWIAKKPVVISPMLSVGQSEFSDGLRFFFLEDVDSAKQFLRSHGVRYVIVTPELDTIAARARVAGLDPNRYRDPLVYGRTIGARLTFTAGVEGFREIIRSPYVRVFEVK